MQHAPQRAVARKTTEGRGGRGVDILSIMVPTTWHRAAVFRQHCNILELLTPLHESASTKNCSMHPKGLSRENQLKGEGGQGGARDGRGRGARTMVAGGAGGRLVGGWVEGYWGTVGGSRGEVGERLNCQP